MQSLEPFPQHWAHAPLVLSVDASFRLKDADTGEAFPLQDPELYGQEADWRLPLGRSRMYLRLSARSTCGLFLFLPFPELTPQIRRYVDRLDQTLPFRLSPKHWSRWQLNANGTQYYKRRIAF